MKVLKGKTLKKAQVELIERGPEFGAAKNPQIADPWQGSPTSVENVLDVKRTQQRIRGEWGAEEGSPGSVSTPTNLEKSR